MSADRRERLERLLEIACAAQGWSKRRLAQALGRDPTKLIPESGNPKLDFVVALAELLGMPVGDVVRFILGPEDAGECEVPNQGDARQPVSARSGFSALDGHLVEAHRRGAFQEMIDLACRAQELAETPEEYALACNREYGGWDGLGRYQSAMEAIRRGLERGPLPRHLDLMLRSNLANAHYSLWNLTEARTIAGEVIETILCDGCQHPDDEATLAFAFYVRGNARRRLLQLSPADPAAIAREASEDLERARGEYQRLAEMDHNETFAAIAHTCEGALLELSVELGVSTPMEAVARVLSALDRTVEDDGLAGEWLESFGWWCVFGSNIALGHLSADEAQQPLAILTNKTHEIARQLDHWALLERAFTLEHASRRCGPGVKSFGESWLMDPEDVAMLVGTMGRFPTFRPTGWRILESAGFVG